MIRHSHLTMKLYFINHCVFSGTKLACVQRGKKSHKSSRAFQDLLNICNKSVQSKNITDFKHSLGWHRSLCKEWVSAHPSGTTYMAWYVLSPFGRPYVLQTVWEVDNCTIACINLLVESLLCRFYVHDGGRVVVYTMPRVWTRRMTIVKVVLQ